MLVMDAQSPIPQQWWEQDAAQAQYQPAYDGRSSVPPQEKMNHENMQHAMYYNNGHAHNHNQQQQHQQQQAISTGPPTFYQHLHRPGTPSQSAQQFPSSYQPTSPYRAFDGRPGSTEPLPYRPNSTEPTGYRPASTEPPMRPVSTEPREEQPQPPSSTGLIRLSLRKPMGIVFEPMTDSSGAQRGVRICDLPRTGAAALSRKLEVGDELLSINDRTMSRLTFDEIMDFIIEADPERVNLLFRRPRTDLMPSKSVGSGTNNMPMPISAPNNSVKWADDHDSKQTRDRDRDKDRRERDRERDSRMNSERLKQQSNNMNKKRRNRERKDNEPWASENFLDMLIDSLCSPLVNDQCKQGPDDDSEADDDDTYFSKDDSTYVTYESMDDKPKARRDKSKFKDTRRDDDSTVDNETMEDDSVEIRIKNDVRNRKTSSRQKVSESENEPYEDDGTLETVESTERATEQTTDLHKKFMARKQALLKDASPVKDDGPPVPIKELEYDVQADAADVSVMTPSLVDTYVSNTALSYGRHNYSPHEPGLTVDESIQKSPQRFYRHVVQHLLETHEPEKVRLLDKLMAKYSGREEHLIQKLTLRYNRQGKLAEKKVPTIQEDESYKDNNTESETTPQNNDEIKDINTSGASIVNTASLASFVTKDNSQNAASNAKMRFANKLESETDKSATVEEPGPSPQIISPPAETSTPDKPKPAIDEFAVAEEENVELAQEQHKQTEPNNNIEVENKFVIPSSPASAKDSAKSLEESETAASSQSSEPEEEKNKYPEPSPSHSEPKNHMQAVNNASSTPERQHDMHDVQLKQPQSPSDYTEDEVEAEGHEVGIDSAEEGSYSGDSAYSGSSLDGTSPAVIAQISELLNYVYGKTTVPGQIDRVSTIMRAYEGREVVLLELLETKALLKANAQSEQQQMVSQQQQQVTSPLSMSGPSVAVGGEFVGREMHDDMSSVSGASFKFNMKNFSDPTSPNNQHKTNNTETPPQVQRSKSQPSSQRENKSITKKPSIDQQSLSTKQSKEKKKFFSLKLFGKKKGSKKSGNASGGSFPSGDQSSKSKSKSKSKFSKNKDALLTRVDSGERSI